VSTAAPRDRLNSLWSRPPGVVGWLAQTNHKTVGRRFLATAFALFLAGGLLALLMRTQLAVPESGFVDARTYNGLFTMHGTIMMFLFVVPMLEGFIVYVGPLMVGARDMPMPRLTAFGYWTFLAGALILLSSFLVGAVPDGGWFAYTPLTRSEFSPGTSLDLWLIGVSMLEVSGITAAVEVVVLVSRTRAPGMTVSRIPAFGWAAIAMAVMIVFAFPPLVAASVLLELDRKFDTVFYAAGAGAGGDPLLWQHLFWFFGHPEVYIQLIPALGIVATVVPVAARRPLALRSWVVAAFVSIAILSFGLWVHHMYAVGIPLLTTSFFTAASAMIAIPSGVVVFAFLATMWWGRLVWSTALRFSVGFSVIFVLGGITGVMVALVPFDWQAHDSYFVVAHFHYVLIGGSVFPILAGLYHWWPKLVGRTLDETWGRWAFWATFVGFNVTFFPQHVLGLWGMPRRVWTYQEGLGWDALNLVSTAGSYLLGVGVLVFVVDAVRTLRRPAEAPADPWGGATLEWSVASPPPPFNFRRFPSVAGPEPRWLPDAPDHSADPSWERRNDALAEPPRDAREGLVTTVLDARPDHVVDLAGPSLWPLGAALALTAAMLGALIDAPSVGIAGVAALAISVGTWLWPSGGETDTGNAARTARALDGEGGRPIGWWGVWLLVTVLGVFLASLIGAAVYLSWGSPWPPVGAPLPALLRPLLVPGLALVGLGAAVVAGRGVRARGRASTTLGLVGGVTAGAGAIAARWLVHRDAAVSATEHAYGSVAAVLAGFDGLVLAVVTLVTGVVLALDVRGHLGRGRHLEVDVAAALWSFAAVTSISAYATVQLLPRL
jgi:cytochrome c oxidase subunit I+III